jgi:hypothetical protein
LILMPVLSILFEFLFRISKFELRICPLSGRGAVW